VIHSLQARRWFSPVSRPGKFLKNPLTSAPDFAIIYLYLYAHVQGLRIRAGRPIHEMGASVLLRFFDGKGLDSHAEQNTLLRAEQSRAEQSRAEQSMG
jgi:hypothetical protein